MFTLEELTTGPFQDHSAIFQNICPVSYLQGMPDILLNQQDSNPMLTQRLYDLENFQD